MLWTVLPAMRLLFDGHAEVEAELEQQLEEDVLLGAVGLQVLDGCSTSVFARFSRSGSHARMLLESSLKTRKPRSPANIGFSSLNLLPGPAQAFFGQFGDVARLAELVADQRQLLVFVLRSSGSGS